MNRRSFIAKAIAGVAAVPLLSRFVEARPQANLPINENGDVVVEWREPTRYVGLIEHGEDGLREVKAKGYQRIPFTEGQPLNFPIAEEDWGYVTHVAFAESPTGPISRLFDLHSWSRRTIRAGQATTLELEIT
jgi:hypothetical protein